MKTKPQDQNLLDFRAAMQITKQPVTFSVSAGTHQASSIPASIREVGLQLGLDPAGRVFSFNQVIRLVLQRGIVLTDNRRLPLRRRFPVSALTQPADLRDGTAVGAEIFRLKNGGPKDRGRFREIQSTFTELTGQQPRAIQESDRSKPRAGAYFAAYHPDPPPAVLGLYKKIIAHLELRLRAGPGMDRVRPRRGAPQTRECPL